MGTSTGGLLAVALGLLKLDMDACDHIYKVDGCCCGAGGVLLRLQRLAAVLLASCVSAAGTGLLERLVAAGAGGTRAEWLDSACRPALHHLPHCLPRYAPCPCAPPASPQVLGRKVFSRVVAAKDAKEESWMEVGRDCGWQVADGTHTVPCNRRRASPWRGAPERLSSCHAAQQQPPPCRSPSTEPSRPRRRTCGPWWSGEQAVV